MIGKIVGLATLPIDIIKDATTLGGVLTDEDSAVKKKLDFITGREEFDREQQHRDIEAIADLIHKIKE